MITAKRIIEEYKASFTSQINKYVEIFMNPTRKDLWTCGSDIRFIADAKEKTIYVWNGNDGLHDEARKALSMFGFKFHQLPGVASKSGEVYIASRYTAGVEKSLNYVSKCLDYDWSWTKNYNINLDPVVKDYFPELLKASKSKFSR
jgi:hypothetical protein